MIGRHNKQTFWNINDNYKKAIRRAKKVAFDNFIRNSKHKVKDSWRLVIYEKSQHKCLNITDEITSDKFSLYFATTVNVIIAELQLH